jgi:Flp pilus assembly protein TadG
MATRWWDRPGVALDRGSLSAFVMLLLVAIFVVLGLVVDGGLAASAREQAADEAEQAARAGAGSISVEALRSGQLQIDDSKAISTAEQFMTASGHPGVATVSSGRVQVAINYRIHTVILGIVGVTTLPVSATATAVDISGVTEGGP